VVFADVAARTLTVRLSEQESGYTKLLWRTGWQALRQAEEAGWPASGAPRVWADAPGARRVVYGLPGEGGTLVFRFPAGTPGFAELVGRPGLTSLVTVDRSTYRILSVKFLSRGGPPNV
jgi:hypothetical protein